MSVVCPQQYQLINGHCTHYLWPPSSGVIIGTLTLGITNSLSTLAGLGGGSIALVILMSFFSYLPKDASLVVFACVLGTSFGNTYNLIFKQYNEKPLIQFHFAFVSIPIVFTGSLIGVIMNRLFPSIITYSLIVFVFFISLNKTYTRFVTEYQKESQQNLLHGEEGVQNIHEESRSQPFKDARVIYIFKNLAILIGVTIVLSFARGSAKFPSIIGVNACSFTYWLLLLASFGFSIFYAYRNYQILKSWYKTNKIQSNSQNINEHVKQIVYKSIGAGIFSGFGLGGAIFLVPMYRNLGCKPLEATATCIFGICLTSFMNCVQAVTIGAIQLSQFLYFVLFLGLLAFIFSKIIFSLLRKRNRFSLVEGILLILTIVAIVNIPISLYNRYSQNGHNPKIIFGFGHFC